MQIRFIAYAGMALVLAAGCASRPVAQQQTGLAAGTAELTVNGQKLDATHSVNCTFIQSMTTITTGTAATGSTVVLDNERGLKTNSVDIRNLGGFTGSYWRTLGRPAEVSATNRTFTITGTADGFTAENPSKRATGDFSIRVSC